MGLARYVNPDGIVRRLGAENWAHITCTTWQQWPTRAKDNVLLGRHCSTPNTYLFIITMVGRTWTLHGVMTRCYDTVS